VDAVSRPSEWMVRSADGEVRPTCSTIDRYGLRAFHVIGLEVALVVLTVLMFVLFDLFVRACDRI
jgi:hypothetical protein